MEIIFTKKFKEKVIHAKDGLKFALKGYAFYSDALPDEIESAEDLTINLINQNKLVLNDYKTGESYREKLFDLTYIPSLEGKIIDDTESGDFLVSQYGTYEIVINKGLFKTLPVSFNYIFLIGEELRENANVVYDLEKSYIAAVIDCSDITNVISEDVEYKPTKIAIQLGLSDLTDVSSLTNAAILVDEAFDSFTEDESIKNINLLKLSNSYTLTPDSKQDYTEEYNYILNEHEQGEINTKFYPGNLTLLDKTEKINNPWNTTPRVYIGLDRPKDISLPHVQLFYNPVGSVDLHSLSVQYNPDYRFLAINQDEGIDNIQADFFPEDMEEENKHCVPERIKRKNVSVDYNQTSNCKSYLRFDANQSYYGYGSNRVFEYNTRGNTVGYNILPTINHSLIYSDSNTFDGETYDVVYLDSDNNEVGYGLSNLSLVNSRNIKFVNSGPRKYVSSLLGETLSYANNNIMIGVNGLYNTPYTNYTASNITFIGNNKNTTYVPVTTTKMFEFDYIKTVKGLFTRHYNNNTETDVISDNLEINLSTSDYKPYYNAGQLFGSQTLIGFNGLTVNKIPNREIFYENQGVVGYNDEWKQYDYYYYGDTTAQINRNASVVFGNYNANDNLDAISAAYPLTVKEAFKLKGRINNLDETFSSFYNNNYTYTTGSDAASARVNIHKLFFNHTQDSIFANENYSAAWKTLTADEGDFGLDKIVVVGDGTQFSDNIITGHSPAEFASNNTTYSNDTSRKNLFSIEKNSYQLVHNGVYDDIPHYSATNVLNIPSMFAVRGTDPVVQQYTYHFITGFNSNNSTFVNKEMYKSINKYNLHHSVYTPTGIFIPLHRSSNDLYKMNFKNVKGLINDNVIKANKTVNYDAIKKLENFDQYSYFIKTKGLEVKDTNGKLITKYDFDMATIVDYYALKGIKIPMSNMNGDNNNVYTFYILNNSPYRGLNFKGFRMNKNGNSVQTLYKNKYIPKGHCVRVDYMDCGTKGRYGVMNFDYWNQTTNSFYK